MSHAAAVARGTDVVAPAPLDTCFSIAFQHSPQPSTIARLTDGTLLEANQSFCDLIGRRRDQILGQSTHALGVWTNALERQRALSAVHLGQSFTIPRHWIRCSNGERRLCRISVLPITLDDELHLVSHFTDITTEHRAQVRLDAGTRILEAALASTRDAVCVVDAHQQVVQFNDALMRLHGFESREQCRAALESPWKSFEVLAADGRTLSFSEWPLIEFQPAGFDPAEVEHGVDQPDQMGGRCFELVQTLRLLGGGSQAPDHRGECDDPVQRRSDVVADVGQECRLGPIGGLGGPGGAGKVCGSFPDLSFKVLLLLSNSLFLLALLAGIARGQDAAEMVAVVADDRRETDAAVDLSLIHI